MHINSQIIKRVFFFIWIWLLQCYACPLNGFEGINSTFSENEQTSLNFDTLEIKKHKKKHKKDKKSKEDEFVHQWPLAVAAIFQNEAPYLKEWIEYYKLIGVRHFYLYDNLSSDNCEEVLLPYVKSGLVELIDWPEQANNLNEWDQIQVAAYRDALQRAKYKAKWLAFIDLDEFIVPIKDDNLSKFLNERCVAKDVGGVCLIWSFFGTSNVEKIPEDKLLIETLLLNSGPAAGGNRSDIWNQGAYKSIVHPELVTAMNSPHYCTYIQGFSHFLLNYDQIHINHYWTRDIDYLNNVKIPRRNAWGQDANSVLTWAAGMNGTSDNNPILRFVPALKNRMKLEQKPVSNQLQ